MPRPTLTVIFDRSAFHGERFDLLANSPLPGLVKKNVLVVHHTPALLEETISMFEREANREELRRQLPFLLDICNGRWFRSRAEIWELELTQNRGPTANVFEKGWRRRLAEENIRRGVFGNADWPDFRKALPEKDAERQKQANIHRIHGEMRQAIADRKKSDRALKQKKPPEAKDYIAASLDDWGRQIISRYIGRRNREVLFELWQRDKSRYPFLTSSLKGQVFSDWFAMAEHNKAIDRNAHVDVEILSCLNRADAIVSADAGFLKDAFDVLWRPKGKLYFTPDDFVTYLKLLQG